MAEATSSSRVARVIDYIFGRNTLIGLASLMLLAISGFATWHGMRDFIVGVSSSPASQQSDLPGGLSISNDALVIGVVVALTFLMWLALRETFGAQRRWRERFVTLPLYLFLALWSVGFGYGFWWSLISGEEATRTGMAGLQEDARDASAEVAARLDAVRAQLDNVVTWSEGQMAREEASGGSCGVPSGAGRGPLYNARRSVRDSVMTLRDGMTKSWFDPVHADVERLRKSAAGLSGITVAERQRDFDAKASEIRGRARSIAVRSNQLGQSTAAEMRALARAIAITPKAPGFSCYDPTLAERLRQAAKQAEQPAVLKLREAVFNEGPAGVANAVKNLWSNIGAYSYSLVSYVFSGGSHAIVRTDGGEPITGRDLIALLASLGIDLGLLVLTILNPPREPPSVRPSGALIRQINAALLTATGRAPGVDFEWVRRHFLHHNKASYFIIPNLASCDPNNEDEASKALAMNQLAGVLSDLDLARWPRPKELDKLRKEEGVASDTDLTGIRKKWAEKEGVSGEVGREDNFKPKLRNHGLFSKAERVLEIAGWSKRARNDIEIFRLVETDGLTPLLMVLNEVDLKTVKEADSGGDTTSSVTEGAPVA